jgi:hypothetical protein
MAVIAKPLLDVAVALKGTGETICAEAPGVLMVTPAQAELVAANEQKVKRIRRAVVWQGLVRKVDRVWEVDSAISLDGFIELLSINIQRSMDC